jgi:hypothetical protein
VASLNCLLAFTYGNEYSGIRAVKFDLISHFSLARVKWLASLFVLLLGVWDSDKIKTVLFFFFFTFKIIIILEFHKESPQI